jgi:predicted Zn-ribbon and HTH transcriptional regulator
MFRKDLIPLLLDNAMSVRELAVVLDAAPRDVENDLLHLLRSLKRTQFRSVLTPAQCRKCGFTFQKNKLLKPGKCPRCHGTWIQEPRVAIVGGDNRFA